MSGRISKSRIFTKPQTSLPFEVEKEIAEDPNLAAGGARLTTSLSLGH